MAKNSENLEFLQYLENTLPDFIEPISQVALAFNIPEGSTRPTGQSLLLNTFIYLGLPFAISSDKLTDKEIDTLHEIVLVVDKNFHTGNHSVRSFYQSLAKKVESGLETQTPACIACLMTYDQVYGTDLADKAKAMVFRFVNIIAKADGQISPNEQDALLKFKQALFSSVAMQGLTVDFKRLLENSKNKSAEKTRTLEELLTELNNLIGL
jgi:tellurite resistance protein